VVVYHPIITVEKTEGSPLSKLPQIAGLCLEDYDKKFKLIALTMHIDKAHHHCHMSYIYKCSCN